MLRLFGRVAASGDRIAGLSTEVAARNLSLARLKGGLQPIYTTLMIAGVILIVWKGSERVVVGAMTVGAFVAYLELFLRFVNRGHRIPQLVNSIQSGAAAYARLRPLLAPALTVEGEPRLASFRPGHIAGIARSRRRALARTPGPVSVALRDLPALWSGSLGPWALARVRSRGRSWDCTPSSLAPCSSTARCRQSSPPTSARGSSDTCPRTRCCSRDRSERISRWLPRVRLTTTGFS